MVTSTAFAQAHKELTMAQIKQNNLSYLKAHGMEALDGEVRIVAAKDFLKSTQGLSTDSQGNQLATTFLKMNKEQKEKGYVLEANPRAQELTEMKNTFKYQMKTSVTNTGLSKEISEIAMGYTFMGVPSTVTKQTFGFAPYGAYKDTENDDDSTGWDGAVEFFDSSNGVCAFTEHNIKLAHSGVELMKELITYDINDKPTLVLTKGDSVSGYTYKISWYDNTFARELECANKAYTSELKQGFIDIAKSIDDYNQRF